MPATTEKTTIANKNQEVPTLLLSDWIHRTLNEAGDHLFAAPFDETLAAQFRDTLALCSDDYLFPALRIARSLADQICKAEDEAAPGQSLPTPSSNWADGIVVHLQRPDSRRRRSNSTKHDRCNSVGVADNLKGNNSQDVDAVYATATTLIQDGKSSSGCGGMPFVDAELLPSLFKSKNGGGSPKHDGSKTERIYSLGLVLYEIFSGGERPPEIEQQEIATKSGDTETGEELNEELLEDLDYLLFDQGGPIDLEGQLSIFDDIEDDFNLFPNKRHTAQKNNHTHNHNKCAVSVEPLKGKSLPVQLCDLIANMVDCINGTLSGENAYQSMTHVRDDLQLMLEKPAIYLFDQDMGKISTTGLHLGDTAYGRHQELSSLKECYRRSVSGDMEFALISGHAGVGKSFLAYEFGKHVIMSGGIFLSGKFDQLQQGKPFSAMAAAFNRYCDMLLQKSELQPMREAMASKLKSSLGRDVYYLTKIMPCLSFILGSDQNDMFCDGDCVNAQRRLQYLLCQLVEILSSSSAAPVTLFLDDLQWADAASIAAVSQLLLNTGSSSQQKRFFFLGCHREGTIDSGHPLWKLVRDAELVGVSCASLKLGCMEEETLNTMVSESLCVLPRLTRTLSNVIYRKTIGNPLFVCRLLLSLSKERLLYPSLSRRRWEWDEEKVMSQKLPDDVALFLTQSIVDLPTDVKTSLFHFSCFGASAEVAFVNTLERALDIRDLSENLDIAVDEGLLEKTGDQYRFSHDRIQEAAYNTVSADERCLVHILYGMALASLSARESDDSILFTAANQLNLGGPNAIQDTSQRVTVAALNLKAGKKAMNMSDFGAAYSYFDNGMSFLREGHWQEHYDLSLELFELAAKCALTNGDFASLKLLSDQVVREARRFEDGLNVMYFATCALAYSSRLPDSIQESLVILKKLGIDLRQSRSAEECVQETKMLLSTHTDEEILNTRQMIDPTMIVALKFLAKLELGMTQTKPRSVPFVTQQIIELSLAKGMSPMSPVGFVHFGALISKCGDISDGYRYVKLALSLLDKVGSRESAGEVICIATQVKCFVEPIQAALEYHDEGYTASMAAGDIFSALANKLLKNSCEYVAGVKLQTLRENQEKTQRLMRENNHVIFLVQIKQVQRGVLKLIGSNEEVTIPEEETLIASNHSVLKTSCFRKSYISFMFRSYDDAKENVSKFFDCREHAWANLLTNHINHALYTGLISFWVARKSGLQYWFGRGNECKLTIKSWAESSQWTFENKWYLLEAEESFSNNDYEAAKSFYSQAISSAKLHKFVHEEALAYELAGYFYLELGEREASIAHFLRAHERYYEWGAFGKCISLFEFVESSFAPSSIQGDFTPSSVGTDGVASYTSDASIGQMMDENAAWMNYINSVRSTQNRRSSNSDV